MQVFGKFNIENRAESIEFSERLSGYSKVIINVSSDLFYEAGSNSGRTLTLSCPWGTQNMANDILGRVQGFRYHPYTANGAIFDPSVEVGDTMVSGDLSGGICLIDATFGNEIRANLAAPGSEEINESVPYKSVTERKIERQYAESKATFRVQASQIAAEVAAREEQGAELRASLNIQADRISQEVADRKNQGEQFKAQFQVQADQISAKVSKTGGSGSSFSWELTDSDWTLKSNNSTVLTASKNGLEVRGIITATGGKIGGFDIQSNYLSYNGQTWGGTNTTGAYLGTSGLQLGKNFKVDMQGNLTATSGKFTGTVYAGSIEYGSSAGRLNGSALTDSTLGTIKFTDGVNTTLGYADYSYGAVNGWNQVNVGEGMLFLNGHNLFLVYDTVNDRKYVSWT